jgi:hypothetical protein
MIDRLASKLSKITKKWYIAVPLTFFLILLVLVLVNQNKGSSNQKNLIPFGQNTPQEKSEQKFNLNLYPDKGEFMIGKKFLLEVYLTGEDLTNVSVIDLKLNYDPIYLKLASAKPGGFFKNPLKAAWKLSSGSFSLATLPSVESGNVDLSQPVLLIELMAVKANIQAEVSFDLSKSIVYLKNKGGYTPVSKGGIYNLYVAQ